MVEVINLPKIELKFKDVFNMYDLLEMSDEWLKENNFMTLQDFPADSFNYETVYTHKVAGGGTFLDSWIWWRLRKYPPESSKGTSYVRYGMNIDMHYLGGATDVEVMHKGKKIKLSKAEVKFDIYPYVELDYRNEWEKKGLLKFFHHMFKKKAYKQEIEQHIGYFYNEVSRFNTLLKQFFNMETNMPEETTYVPPKGLI